MLASEAEVWRVEETEKGVYVLAEEVIHTTGGGPLRVTRAYKLKMQRIDDSLLHSIIYLYPSPEEAEAGEEIGGTGFMVSVKSETHPDYHHVYAVSNAHVVHEQKASVVRTTAASRLPFSVGMAGNREIIPLAVSQWKPHKKDDIAIAPLGVDRQHSRFAHTIPSHMLLRHEVINLFDLGAGDEVYMVGRFAPHAGKHFNQPSVRSGIISQMHDYVELEEGSPEEIFLVEMRSISGYSGSPVFWDVSRNAGLKMVTQWEKYKPIVSPDGGEAMVGPWLVGVDCGSFPHYYPLFEVSKDKGKVTRKELPQFQAKSHTGISGVIPAWKLKDLLDLEEFAVARKEADRKLSEEKKGGRFDRDAASREDAPEFTSETFEEALRRASRKISPPDEEKSE